MSVGGEHTQWIRWLSRLCFGHKATDIYVKSGSSPPTATERGPVGLLTLSGIPPKSLQAKIKSGRTSKRARTENDVKTCLI